MSRRLQVLVDERELREIRRVAGQQHMTVAEWVRQVLRRAYRREPGTDGKKKLAALRVATKLEYPTGNIEQMLGEIEAGYVSDSRK